MFILRRKGKPLELFYNDSAAFEDFQIDVDQNRIRNMAMLAFFGLSFKSTNAHRQNQAHTPITFMRRRSQKIQLIAMGSIVLNGCGSDLPDDRYVYHNQAQCVQDWGETNCEQPKQSYSGHSHVYFGPHYDHYVYFPNGQRVWSGNANSHPINPSTGNILGTQSVNVTKRGGFGSSVHHFFSRGG